MLVNLLVVATDARRRIRLERASSQLADVRATIGTPDQLWDLLNRGDFDLVLIDRASLSQAPAPIVAAIRQLPEEPEVVAITDHQDGELRAGLLAAGCLTVLDASLEEKSLLAALRALVTRRRGDMVRRLGTSRPQDRTSLRDFESESPTMQQFVALVGRVVNTDSSLLLLGETGSGKEHLASAIHRDGPRGGGPFLCVNCPALPETLLESELFGHEMGAFTGATRARRGCFEQAHGGTIFLDEIAEMPLHLQAKLLRVLESRTVQRLGGEVAQRVDVRIMAATNRDLDAEVAAGRFRPDLFFRLAVVSLRLPPLRERREDIPGLVASYLGHFASVMGGQPRTITPRALEALVRHDWPGNVRELINIIERTTLLTRSPEIDLEDLPAEIGGAVPLGRNGSAVGPALASPKAADWRGIPLADAREKLLASFHREYLAALLAEHRGRVGDSARAAGVHVRTLYQLMKKYGLRKEDYRPAESLQSRSASE